MLLTHLSQGLAKAEARIGWVPLPIKSIIEDKEHNVSFKEDVKFRYFSSKY